MNYRDTNKLNRIYKESVIFVAKPGDLGPQSPEMSFNIPKPEQPEEHHHSEEENDPSEIHMAKSELMNAHKCAAELFELVSKMDGLEGWVAAKITKASDYLNSVRQWIEYKSQENNECGCEDEECSCEEQM